MPFLGWPEMILVALILLMVFGPERMPQMARALGEAVREYRKVAEAPLQDMFNPPKPTVVTPPKPTEKQVLIDTAKKLGITTEGKTTEQLAEEILKKASEVSKELTSQPAPQPKPPPAPATEA